jgi:hypothetical protein
MGCSALHDTYRGLIEILPGTCLEGQRENTHRLSQDSERHGPL